MNRYFLLLFLPLLLIDTFALEVKRGAFRNSLVFGIQVYEGEQEFIGRVSRINSISLQNYTTATFDVLELTIDFEGSPLQLRIYNTQVFDPTKPAKRIDTGMDTIKIPEYNLPNTLQKPLNTINRNINVPLNKEYPTTTHAKTIEYRIGNRAELQELYDRIRTAWTAPKADPDKKSDENYKTIDQKAMDAVAESLGGTLYIIDGTSSKDSQ